jgi:hypothetical protein
MQYRSAIKGVPRQPHRVDSEYWALVQRLMDAGWYRLGQDRDPSGKSWGFRSGHTTHATTYLSPRGSGAVKPTPRPEERWIEAKDELSAMRRLLREL